MSSTFVYLERSGPLATELVVNLELSGELAGSAQVPPIATFAAGQASTSVVVDVEGEGGSLAVVVVAGAGYVPGSPSSTDLSFTTDPAFFDCTRERPVTSWNAEQTIRVGERPTDLHFGEITSEVPVASFDRTGALPPGLAVGPEDPSRVGRGPYTWIGAATTPGSYRSVFTLCILFDGLNFCVGRSTVTITVLPLDGGPSSGAAQAITTTARFTG